MLRLIETPAAIGEVVNLGSDREVTISRLAEMVRDVAGSSSEIVRVPYDEAYAQASKTSSVGFPTFASSNRSRDFASRLLSSTRSEAAALLLDDICDDAMRGREVAP